MNRKIEWLELLKKQHKVELKQKDFVKFDYMDLPDALVLIGVGAITSYDGSGDWIIYDKNEDVYLSFELDFKTTNEDEKFFKELPEYCVVHLNWANK